MMGGKVEEKGRGAYVSSPSPELVEGELERGYNSGEWPWGREGEEWDRGAISTLEVDVVGGSGASLEKASPEWGFEE